MYPLTMTLNGESVTVEVEPFEILVDVLRDKLGLTGTKIGCNEGECGACTVIMDGQAVLSCLLPAMKAAASRWAITASFWLAVASTARCTGASMIWWLLRIN